MVYKEGYLKSIEEINSMEDYKIEKKFSGGYVVYFKPTGKHISISSQYARYLGSSERLRFKLHRIVDKKMDTRRELWKIDGAGSFSGSIYGSLIKSDLDYLDKDLFEL